jgi:hypothetical protein
MSIMLGRQPISSCNPLDENVDTTVTIAEIKTALDIALFGPCARSVRDRLRAPG